MTQPAKHKRANETLLDWLGIASQPDWNRAKPFGVIVGTFLAGSVILLFVFAVIAAFTVLYDTAARAISSTGTGPNLGAGAMIAALLGAPFVIWGTVIRARALEFQKEGHITDRISAAVEQLGAEKTVKRKKKDSVIETTVPNIEVRIGGLLSLERIAQDSTRYDKGRDHVRVMEIICAYIRENAPASSAVELDLPEWEDAPESATVEELEEHIEAQNNKMGWPGIYSVAWRKARKLPLPRQDIQTALTIIGRRDADQRRVEARWGPDTDPEAENFFDSTPCPNWPEMEETVGKDVLNTLKEKTREWVRKARGAPGYHPDLRGCNLQRADMASGKWAGCRFNDTHMQGADLRRAEIQGADLRRAEIQGADLRDATMQGAFLLVTKMQGAILIDANMQGANLSSAKMQGADLRRAEMQGANLRRAEMQGANLRRAEMQGAILSSAEMQGANLMGAEMQGADLSSAEMDHRTSLKTATFQGAVLRDVDLTKVELSQDQVKSMFGDATVTLPGGKGPDSADWPDHWPKWKLLLAGPNAFKTQYKLWLSDPDNYPLPEPPTENP